MNPSDPGSVPLQHERDVVDDAGIAIPAPPPADAIPQAVAPLRDLQPAAEIPDALQPAMFDVRPLDGGPAPLAAASMPLAAAPLPVGPVPAAPIVGGPVGGAPTAPGAPVAVDNAGLPMAHPQPSAWERLGEELLTWFKTLASAAVYATLIVTFVCQVARVEGQSMLPTLEDQDRLIVNKLIYRLSEPHPGDIVMLYYPNKPEKSFVKRVIAKELDEVRIVDGKVMVNGEQINDVYVPPQYRSYDDFGPHKVKEGYYFVMGDHRNNSSDSRHWGEVPKKYIIGKVQLRWWPLNHARIFE